MIYAICKFLGHISSETTLNIYTHTTESMKRSAADKIERGIGKKEGNINEVEQTPDQDVKKPVKPKFEPKQPKIRCPGTGCISQIHDHLYEGRYSPIDAHGKRISRNIYAKNREECEIKLAEMIVEMKAEIKAGKEKLKVLKPA